MLIINKQTGQSHLDYDGSRDFGRTKMSVKTLTAPVETFKVELRAEGRQQRNIGVDVGDNRGVDSFNCCPVKVQATTQAARAVRFYLRFPLR